MGIDYLGMELSMEVRLSILERLKANEGGLEAEDLQELGLYTEYRNVAAGMAALLEASYCGSRFEQTLYSIDELHRADRQAEVQMLLRFFENTTIMASVQDYNAAGSAIREPGSTVATKGYESGPGDGKQFNYTGTRYATDASFGKDIEGDVSGIDSNITDNNGHMLISPEDKTKIEGWKYRPSDENYCRYKSVYDNPRYYNQTTGEIEWPENDGFLGKSEQIELKPGTMIDRYGSDEGIYTSPYGTPYTERSLSPGSEMREYNVYEVLEPIQVEGGIIAPWFDEAGGGVQYILPEKIEELIEAGILRKVELD